VTVPNVPLDVIAMPESSAVSPSRIAMRRGHSRKNGKTFSLSPLHEGLVERAKRNRSSAIQQLYYSRLTVHEAMPGIFCNSRARMNSARRTLVRRNFPEADPSLRAGRFIAKQVMAEQGYGGPEVKMQQLKMRLRAIATPSSIKASHAET